MTIHYQKANGDEVMLSGVIHLQNMDDNKWVALMDDDRELTLLTCRIEGIYHKETCYRNISILERRTQKDADT